MSLTSKEILLKNDCYSWALTHWRLPNGDPYDLKDYAFIKDILKRKWEPGDQVFIKKSSQCTASEYAAITTVWMADRGLKGFKGIGYFFPAKKQLDAHVKSRFMPILGDPKYFSRKVDHSNLSYIAYNNIPIQFRCGHSRDMKSFTADFAVIDEFDEFEDPIGIVPAIETRQNASDYRMLLGLSTPTYPDLGIDKYYSMSSQNNWYIKCDVCHKEFSPLNEVLISGFENVVDKGQDGLVGFVCPHCKDLTQTNGKEGRWIQDVKKDNQRIGYSISRLFVADRKNQRYSTLAELYRKYEEALNPTEFYNSDLGLPYCPPNSRLERKDIEDLCYGDAMVKGSARKTWCGVDVGIKCHYVIGTLEGNKIKVIAYGTCGFNELHMVFSMYNVEACVIDLRPYENDVKNTIRGRRGFFACDFNVGKQEDWFVINDTDIQIRDKSVKIIRASKTQSCDRLIHKFVSEKGFIFPSQTKGDNNFISHLVAPMRINKQNKDTGDIIALYNSANKADHYFFALVYLILAFEVKRHSIAKLGGIFF